MSQQRPVVIADKVTREVIFEFRSVAHAANVMCLKEDMVRGQCRLKALSRSTETYFRFKDTFDAEEMFAGRVGCPIYIRHENKLRVFYSLPEFADALQIANSTACKCLEAGKWKGIEVGYLDRGLKGLAYGN